MNLRTFRLTLAVVVLGAASPLSAECIGPGLPYSIESAEVIFQGRLREIDTFYAGVSTDVRGFRVQVITVDVSTFWKGDVGAEFTLHMMPMSSVDGVSGEFEVGGEYLVFARLNDDLKQELLNADVPTFSTSSCAGVFRLGDGSAVGWWRDPGPFLRALGPGQPTKRD